jgi:hypothetical protein
MAIDVTSDQTRRQGATPPPVQRPLETGERIVAALQRPGPQRSRDPDAANLQSLVRRPGVVRPSTASLQST